MNEGVGPFSTFIREYTAQQHLLRQGEPMNAAAVQNASDAIARNVARTVDEGNGDLPSFVDIGRVDAGTSVGASYGDPNDFSPWSGALLFAALGEGSFYTGHLLDPKNGSYDLFAAMRSAEVASSAAAASSTSSNFKDALVDILYTVAGNNLGAWSTLEQITALASASQAYLQRHFPDFTGDFSTLLLSDYDLGAFGRDDQLYGDAHADIINGASGNDTITGSRDSDFIDGGEGRDTLDYTGSDYGLKVVVKNTPADELGLVIRKETQGTDKSIHIERLLLSGSHNDHVTIDPALKPADLLIDAGAQPRGKYDVLDFSDWTSGPTLTTTTVESAKAIKVEDLGLTFRNFEVILGSSVIDTLVAHPGGVHLYGGDGADTLTGGAGDDTLEGGPGKDELRGGPGKDTFILDGADDPYDRDSYDIVLDADPEDRIFIRAAVSPADGSGAPASELLIPLMGGMHFHHGYYPPTNSTFENDPLFQAAFDDDRLVFYNRDYGFPHSFFESHELDVIYSRDGADLVVEARYAEGALHVLGDVVVKGYSTGDLGLIHTEAVSPIGLEYHSNDPFPQQGVAAIKEHATKVLAAGNFSSAPHASDHDLIDGLSGLTTRAERPRQVPGSSGSDMMIGGWRDDTLAGGQGDDTYVVVKAVSAIIEIAAGGHDSVHSSVDFALPAHVERLDLTGSGDLAGFGNELGNVLIGNSGANALNGLDGNDTIEGGAGADYIDGGAGIDLLIGNEGSDELHGSEGDDAIYSGGEADILVGEGGNDALYGGDGADFLAGGDGNDVLVGESGNDRLEGSAGGDFIVGNEGADEIFGGGGNDVVFAGQDRDVISGEAGNDEIYGGEGADYISAGSDGDIVIGDGGDDTLFGGEGGDYVVGGIGNDVVVGEGGNDALIGGAGADYLIGGAGADEFIYYAASESNSVALDVVADFETGIDKLNPGGCTRAGRTGSRSRTSAATPSWPWTSSGTARSSSRCRSIRPSGSATSCSEPARSTGRGGSASSASRRRFVTAPSPRPRRRAPPRPRRCSGRRAAPGASPR